MFFMSWVSVDMLFGHQLYSLAGNQLYETIVPGSIVFHQMNYSIPELLPFQVGYNFSIITIPTKMIFVISKLHTSLS
jgi:hypothetical protein